MNGLVEKIKGIILTPKETLPKLAAEPGTISGLFTGYVAILAAIPAVAGFLGVLLFPVKIPLIGTVRVPLTTNLVQHVVSYVLTLAVLYVMAIIVENIAPSFGGQKDLLGAARALAYSMTPGMVAGVLMIVPALAPLSILAGLYGLYLLFLALPIFLKVPQEKAVVFTLVVIGVAIVVGAVFGGVMSLISRGASDGPVTFQIQ